MTLGITSIVVALFCLAYIAYRMGSWVKSKFGATYIDPHVRRHHTADQAQAIHTSCITILCGSTSKLFNSFFEAMGTRVVLGAIFLTNIFSDLCRAIDIFTRFSSVTWKTYSLGRASFQQETNWYLDFYYSLKQLYSSAKSTLSYATPELFTISGSLFVQLCIGIPVLRTVFPESWFSRFSCWFNILHASSVIYGYIPTGEGTLAYYVSRYLLDYYMEAGIFSGGYIAYQIARWNTEFEKYANKTKALVTSVAVPVFKPRPEKEESEPNPFETERRARSRSRKRK